jgi:hypothetical protein
MFQIVLAQKVFAIVVAIVRSIDAVDVLLHRRLGVSGKVRQVGGALAIEFNRDPRAVHAAMRQNVSAPTR